MAIKCSIYRLPVNGLDENVGHRIHQKMGEIGHDYQYGTLKIPPQKRGPQYPLGQLTSNTCNKFQNTVKSLKKREAGVDVIVMAKYV